MPKSYLFAACLVALFLEVLSARATIDITLQMQLGNPSGASADTNNHDHFLIQRTVEAIDYSDNLGEPNWASWDLTTADLGSSGRSPAFLTDTNLPGNFLPVDTTQYSGSGYDRGHMCPSADRTVNSNDNNTLFFLSNIIPQAPNNNEGVWGNFEDYCRTLANSGNELLITCGPGGFNGAYVQPSTRIQIGGYVWKVVVVVPNGAGTALSRITSATRVIAIKIPNVDSVNSSWQTYVTSVKQIEADTGFTFFTALPGGVADALRVKVDGVTGAPPGITNVSTASGAVNDSVVLTGTNFTSASEVTFSGASAAFTVNSATQITTTVPTNATTGLISVTTPKGTALSASSFTVTGSTVDVAVVSSHFGNFSQGDTGDTYTITVTNVGNLACTNIITVSNSLPAGLTATAISGVGWNANLATLTCTRSNTLYPGAGYPPIILSVNVAANAATNVTNVVMVSTAPDANALNNTNKDTTVINPSLITGTIVTLAGWDMHGLPGGVNDFGTSPLPPTTIAANTTNYSFIRGSGVGTTGTGATRGWGGNNWTSSSEAAAIGANQFVSFAISAQATYKISFTAINQFDYRRSATGPPGGVLQYQIGTGAFVDAASISYPSNTSGGGSLSPINLSGISALQNIGGGTNVTFRIVNFGGSSSVGTWYVFDVTNTTALDFVVQGTVQAPITPDLTVTLMHAGNFTQADSGDAYSLTVSNLGSSASVGIITVSNALPAGLTATAISGSGWTANLATLTCTRSESLAPGAAYPPITITVDVSTNAAISVTNIAIVSGGSDSVLTNNIAKDPTTIVALTPVQLWRYQNFGSTADSGLSADATVVTSDGLPNLYKYAFGFDPNTVATNPIAPDLSTGYLSLTLPKNPMATDVSFIIEGTPDILAPWSTVPIVIDVNTSTQLKAHYNVPVNGSDSGFIRLRITRP